MGWGVFWPSERFTFDIMKSSNADTDRICASIMDAWVVGEVLACQLSLKS